MKLRCITTIAIGLWASACGQQGESRLEIAVEGRGGTIPPVGSHAYPSGTAVRVTAVPADGATFTRWSGAATGAGNPVDVVVDGERTLVAHFSGSGGSSGGGSSGSNGGSSGSSSGSSSSSGAGTRHSLVVTRAGAGSGTVSGEGIDCGSTCSGTFAAGASVTLTASAASGSTFAGWSGACSGTGATCTVSMSADRTVGATFSAATLPTTYANPVLWEDLADLDVFRVDDTFYYSASNMHYSPGAPILRSYDLVNWEHAGHSIPVLDFSPAYDLNGGRAYVKGTWASFLNYRKSNKTFYWGGCIEFGKTYIYTATSVEGPWQKHPPINNCYYDAGLLVDDDDTMYVAYGNSNISVAQLTPDGLGQVRTQRVFTSSFTLEGSRFYKKDGSYYILLTRPANAEFVLRSTTGPFGPYESRPLLDNVRTPVPGGGVPHQGGLVATQNGDWYYMGFVDAYPGGRIPTLAPITWRDGWPVLELVNGGFGASYPYPKVPPPPRATKPHTGVERFEGTKLDPEWEWNHNPDNARWSLSGGLRLETATVTNDLYQARNTLTRRILGPSSTATIVLDYSGMRDGDRAGLALLRDSSAWVGVRRDGGATRVAMVTGLTMDGNWRTTGTGSEAASAAVSGGRIWLRLAADIRPGAGRKARFSYSTDGQTFTPIGAEFTMGNAWQFFMGYRFAVFNYATQALGGSVTVPSFELATP